jgi:hypothetical protein
MRTPSSIAKRARLHRDQAIAALEALTDGVIDQLARRGQLLAVPDGFPPSTLGDGTPPSAAALTSVEAAAYRRLGVPDTATEGGLDEIILAAPDPSGLAISDLFADLFAMNNLAARITLDRKYLDAVKDAAVGRVSSLQGSCLCCGRSVSGAAGDRLRGGLCQADDRALRRAVEGGTAPLDAGGQVDKERWYNERRAVAAQLTPMPLAVVRRAEDLTARHVEAEAAPRSLVTGGFKRGVGEVAS